MTAYFADLDSGNDSNDGLSTGAPWLTMQKVADTAIAGDVVKVKGTQTLTTTITFATNNGTTTNAIEIIGVNDSWVEDGTQFTIDGDSAVTYCITRSVQYVRLKNAEIINATQDNLENGYYWILDNVTLSNSGRYGVQGSLTEIYSRCLMANNASRGFTSNQVLLLNCKIFNSSYGGYANNVMNTANCLIYNCATVGLQFAGNVCLLADTIIDDCGSCIITSQFISVYNTRLTNFSNFGVNFGGLYVTALLNNIYFYSTSGLDITNDNAIKANILTTADNSGDGYVNQATRDYTLTDGEAGTAVEIPIGLLTNTSDYGYFTAGIPPQSAGGGGGGLKFHPGMDGGLRG